ncbi:hypothetical protein G6F62_015529 [Rhizopus arrhizus]|nr:hypothetical protein G6F62_015529 [Rhizopus arrhizus]
MPALALYDEIRQSYAGLERVASAAARLRAFRGGQLSVIALPAFSHSILPDAFRRFHDLHPGVSLALEAQEAPFLEEWLTAQRGRGVCAARRARAAGKAGDRSA